MEKNIYKPEFSGNELSVNPEKNYLSAKKELIERKEHALFTGNYKKAALACNSISECSRRLGNYADTEKYRQKAKLLFKETDNTNGLLWTRFIQATEQRQKGSYSLSTNNLIKVYKKAILRNDAVKQHYSLAGVAENYRIIGFYKVAFKLHKFLLKRSQEFKNYRGIIWALEGIGQMLKNIGQIDSSFKYYSKAKEMAIRFNDIRALGYAYKALGELWSFKKNKIKSYLYFEKSMNVLRENKSLVPIAYTYKSFGEASLRLDDLENASHFIYLAKETFQNASAKRGIAYTQICQGDLIEKLFNNKTGIRYYLKAYSFFLKEHIWYGKYQCSKRVPLKKLNYLINYT